MHPRQFNNQPIEQWHVYQCPLPRGCADYNSSLSWGEPQRVGRVATLRREVQRWLFWVCGAAKIPFLWWTSPIGQNKEWGGDLMCTADMCSVNWLPWWRSSDLPNSTIPGRINRWWWAGYPIATLNGITQLNPITAVFWGAGSSSKHFRCLSILHLSRSTLIAIVQKKSKHFPKNVTK